MPPSYDKHARYSLGFRVYSGYKKKYGNVFPSVKINSEGIGLILGYNIVVYLVYGSNV